MDLEKQLTYVAFPKSFFLKKRNLVKFDSMCRVLLDIADYNFHYNGIKNHAIKGKDLEVVVRSIVKQ